MSVLKMCIVFLFGVYVGQEKQVPSVKKITLSLYDKYKTL